jgi:hypothetical protein
VRPYQYREIFERLGWVDVSITPLERTQVRDSSFAMSEQFRDARNQLDLLSVAFCARKA